MDFGRLSDLSVFWPVQVMQNLLRRPPYVLELANIPYKQQEQVLLYTVRRLPRFRAGVLDATGNGGYLAEAAAQEWGWERIIQLKLHTEWYREEMPKFIAAFEDGNLVLPKDSDLLNDHAALKKVDGVIKVPNIRAQDTKDKSRKRHGDSAVAHALAWYATLLNIAPIDFVSTGQARSSTGVFTDNRHASDRTIDLDEGFGVVRSPMNLRGY